MIGNVVIIYFSVGAQMAALYGQGAPTPAMQTPYGRGTTMGDSPQPTVPSGRRPSPPQSQERRPSPPQSQQRTPEVCNSNCIECSPFMSTHWNSLA